MSRQDDLDRLFQLTGLSNEDLADTIAKNPRAYMNLKGAVAETHLQKYLERAIRKNEIHGFRRGQGDFEKDFYIQVRGNRTELALECKNVQVVKVSRQLDRRAYLEFLVGRGHLSANALSALLPNGHNGTDMLRAPELKDIFKRLPIEMRESGIPKYEFSRELCGIDQAPALNSKNCENFLSSFQEHPLSIDFQRTRNSANDDSVDSKANRFYELGEIDLVGACLFSRTLDWKFIFCSAKRLPRHEKYPNRYSNKLVVSPRHWKAELIEAIDDL